jgi:hypothetical protein
VVISDLIAIIMAPPALTGRLNCECSAPLMAAMDACKALQARRCRAGPRGAHREAHVVDEVRDAQPALRDAGQRASNHAWLDLDNADVPVFSVDEHGEVELWSVLRFSIR